MAESHFKPVMRVNCVVKTNINHTAIPSEFEKVIPFLTENENVLEYKLYEGTLTVADVLDLLTKVNAENSSIRHPIEKGDNINIIFDFRK